MQRHLNGYRRPVAASFAGAWRIAWPTALAAAIATYAGLPARAADPSLNISPGLWEITMQAQSNGQLPVPEEALAKMSPEQRAKLEAAMREAIAQPHKLRECLTEEKIRQGIAALDPQKNPACTRTVVNGSPTVLDLRESCTGENPRTATVHVEAPDPHTMHGTSNMQMTHGTRTMSMKGTMDGAWVSADCGGVLPDHPEME